MRTALALAVITVAATSPARADFVILDLPGGYTPGTPFTVGVGLSPVSNLGLYNVEVVFRTTGPAAGVLSVTSPQAAASGYVFPSASNFLASPVVSGTDYRLTLSDFTLGAAGTTVIPGVNDRITSLTVNPASTLSGPITVFVEPTSLQLDDPAGMSLLGTGSPPAGIIPAAVPGPPAWACGVCGLVVLGAFRRRLATHTLLS